MAVSANKPQAKFLALTEKFRLFVAGFGSGKTWVGCMRICMYALRFPGMQQGYFAPTAADVRDIFFPTIEEVAEAFGMKVVIRRGEKKEVDLILAGKKRCTIICKSMDRPESIVGFKIGHALIDELDTMPMDKAKTAWRKIIARLRWVNKSKAWKAPNSADCTTTPEGFGFVYEQWVMKGGPKYAMVQASTYDNEINLPDDYIDALLETYPAELIDAYLNGKFVNLKSGTVFYAYKREANRSHETIQPGEPLRIGLDFNIGNMSAVVYVKRGEAWHAVEELVNVFDTPDMIDLIQTRYEGHAIRVYPDATGARRDTRSKTGKGDIGLIESAGLLVYANKQNPAVKDRVLATNVAFEKGLLYINDNNCPEYARCMEQLPYDDYGQPNKKLNLDHLPDAGTYPIAYEMPITKPIHTMPVRYAC